MTGIRDGAVGWLGFVVCVCVHDLEDAGHLRCKSSLVGDLDDRSSFHRRDGPARSLSKALHEAHCLRSSESFGL